MWDLWRKGSDAVEFKWYKNELSDYARSIREKVFCDEQGVLPEEDFDGSDRHSESVVLLIEEPPNSPKKPVATGRIIVGARGEATLGRIACVKEERGKGYGAVIVKELMRRCGEKGFDTVYVHSQTRAKGFYEKLGFKEYGDVYMEAGIAHINMVRGI